VTFAGNIIQEIVPLRWKTKHFRNHKKKGQIYSNKYTNPEEVLQENIHQEKGIDTVAVGISSDGREIVIAANVKRRRGEVFEKGMRYVTRQSERAGISVSSDYGLHDGLYEDLIRRGCEAYFQTEKSTITIIAPEEVPQSP